MARFRLNRLPSDPYLGACFPDASFNDDTSIEASAHVADVHGHSLELERRCPRDHLQPRHVRERVDDLFADPVAKVILLGVRTHVHEWQHGNRRRILSDRGFELFALLGWLCIELAEDRLITARAESNQDGIVSARTL